MTTPSSFQQAIFDHVSDKERGNLVVVARAGSGKTWTLVEAMACVPARESVGAFAFNKSIATELADRVPEGVDVLTFHSHGLRAVTAAFGRQAINAHRCRDMVDQIMGRDYDTRTLRGAAVKLVGLAKNTLASTVDDLDELIDSFMLDAPCTCAPGARSHDRRCPRMTVIGSVLKVLEVCADPKGEIDFDDMIWLPARLDLKVKQFDRVFVDEAQDLNAAQLDLVLRTRKPGGRVVAVGDDRQAIYGFRGATSSALDVIRTTLAADVLPLSICYRCPRSVVALAAVDVPDFTPAPGAAEGSIESIAYERLFKAVRPGDFVLSRSNAPLVSTCMRLLRDGVRATIAGRDIGAGLVAWLSKVKCRGVDGLRERIVEWQDSELKRLYAKDHTSEDQLNAVIDRADTLLALCEGASTVPEVVARAESLFVDGDSAGKVLLSSTHKAKGLERDRVFVLSWTYRKRAAVEESNLWYVAITRSKRELFLVVAPEAK